MVMMMMMIMNFFSYNEAKGHAYNILKYFYIK